MKLSERVGKIRPSQTMAMAARAKQMTAQGKDVIDLSLGEPDLDTPDRIKEAAIEAIRQGHTKYTPPAGIPALKKAISEKLLKDQGLSYRPNEIIVSCGAKHSLYNLAQALLDRGDEVIIPAPYWVSYPDQVILNDATPVIIRTREEERFLLTPDLLERVITPRSKVLILNSPSNPTGSAYDRKSLEGLAEAAVRHDLLVISDEIYEKILYAGKKHVSIGSLGPEIKKRTVVVNGVSKSYAMTGWRIGYTAGPENIIAAMTSVQSQSTSNPTSISQMAALAALQGDDAFTVKMVEEFDRRRKFAVDRLNAIKGISCLNPDGAFFLFPNISGIQEMERKTRPLRTSVDVANYLLEEALVCTVPGEAFGSDHHLRISYAAPMETMKEALDRIEEAVGRIG